MRCVHENSKTLCYSVYKFTMKILSGVFLFIGFVYSSGSEMQVTTTPRRHELEYAARPSVERSHRFKSEGLSLNHEHGKKATYSSEPIQVHKAPQSRSACRKALLDLVHSGKASYTVLSISNFPCLSNLQDLRLDLITRHLLTQLHMNSNKIGTPALTI